MQVICGAMFGIFFVFSLSLFLSKFDLKYLKFLGANSLTIMAVHEPIKRIVIFIISKLLKQDSDVVRQQFLTAIIILIVVTLISSYLTL